MKTRFILATMATSLSLAMPQAASADMVEMDMGKEATRVLRIIPGLCPASITQLKQWAVGFDKLGSFAVPAAPRGVTATCDNPGPAVPAGQSMGYDTREAANATALQVCNAERPAGFGECIVIAHAHDL